MWTPSQRASAVESANAPLDVAKIVQHVKDAARVVNTDTEEMQDTNLPTFLDHILNRKD